MFHKDILQNQIQPDDLVKVNTGTANVCVYRPFIGGGQRFWRFYPDGRVPLSRWEHDHLIQKLINTGQQVLSVLGLVCDVMKDLNTGREGGSVRV